MKKIILSLLILLPLFTFAAPTDYVLLEPLPCIQNTGQGENSLACADGTLIKKISTETYIAYIFNFSIAFAAVAAVLVITYAGFEYALSDMVTKKSDAKTRIWNAIWGLLTLIGSYLILETVDPRLVDINTKLPEIDVVGYKFDYDALVNTATDYKIREDLKTANSQAKTIEEKVANLRKAADEAEDEEKSVEFRTQALELEREANLIRYIAVAEAQYDMGSKLLSELPWRTEISRAQFDEINLRKESIANTIDEDIKKMRDSGDIAGAEIMTGKKELHLLRLDQAVYLIPKIKSVNYSVKYEPAGSSNKKIEKTLSEIEAKRFPNTLNQEDADLLEKDRREVIDALKALIRTQE